MAQIKKKTAKRVVYGIIAILVVFGLYKAFAGPDYDDPSTPKPVFGNPDSSVKVIEFGDIQCPACKAAHPTVQRIKEDYKDKISFEYYHFPLRNIHPYAQKAAEAAECANDQGKFWEYLDAAFAQSPSLQTKNLKIIAAQLGLDAEKFDACLDSGKKAKVVEGDFKFGSVKKVPGTPAFFVNDRLISDWSYASLSAAIEQELR